MIKSAFFPTIFFIKRKEKNSICWDDKKKCAFYLSNGIIFMCKLEKKINYYIFWIFV